MQSADLAIFLQIDNIYKTSLFAHFSKPENDVG